MVVHEPVVDLVSQMAIDQISDLVALAVVEYGNRVVKREERGVALGHEVLDENEALARAHDGKGQKDTEEEGGHAGHCDVHSDIAASSTRR